MTVEIDEEGLVKGKFDCFGKINVDVDYVKKLILDAKKYALRNTALMHDLAEVTAERDKLIKALGGDDGRESFCVVRVDCSGFFSDDIACDISRGAFSPKTNF